MSTRKAKSSKKRAPSQTTSWAGLFREPWRSVALVVLTISLFAGAWYVVWRDIRETLLADRRYRLSIENVEIPPLPAWIRSDIRNQVFLEASLDESCSILDPSLARRIGEAFALHPWVDEVVEVRKSSHATVAVDLIYRRPVCMVTVPGGMLPVDIEGIHLPTADFLSSPQEAFCYPRLVGANTVPVGPVGTRWGDARVTAAAKIAAAFGPAWQKLALDRIIAPDLKELDHRGDEMFEILTQGGTRILWGSSPETNSLERVSANGEDSAKEKVARLLDYARQNGSSLEGANGPQQIDLRKASRVDTTPLSQGGRAANQEELPLREVARSRWSLNFVKNLTIFEVSSTGRQGRQPSGASAPRRGPHQRRTAMRDLVDFPCSAYIPACEKLLI